MGSDVHGHGSRGDSCQRKKLKCVGLTCMGPDVVLSLLTNMHVVFQSYDEFCFPGWHNVCVCVLLGAGWDSLTCLNSSMLTDSTVHTKNVNICSHTCTVLVLKKEPNKTVYLWIHNFKDIIATCVTCRVAIKEKACSGTRPGARRRVVFNWVIMCCFTRAVLGRNDRVAVLVKSAALMSSSLGRRTCFVKDSESLGSQQQAGSFMRVKILTDL